VLDRPAEAAGTVRGRPGQHDAGDHDTGDFVRDKNNLNGTFFLQNPFLDVAADLATTQRRTFRPADPGALPSAAFRRFLVQGVAGMSGTHAMPDAEECGAGSNLFR